MTWGPILSVAQGGVPSTRRLCVFARDGVQEMGNVRAGSSEESAPPKFPEAAGRAIIPKRFPCVCYGDSMNCMRRYEFFFFSVVLLSDFSAGLLSLPESEEEELVDLPGSPLRA